jgi:hypothetical protein
MAMAFVVVTKSHLPSEHHRKVLQARPNDKNTCKF